MIVISFLSITLVLAILSIRALYQSVKYFPLIGWSRLGLGISLSGFVFLYGAWIYISAYGKYIIPGLAIIVIGSGLLRRPARKSLIERRESKALNYIISGTLLVLCVLYFTGTETNRSVVRLSFPLHPGRYFVLQGGRGLPSNLFHYNSRRAAYAMDIVALDTWGRRANKVFSTKLKDYFIYGDTIYAPCDGKVLRAVSDNPDNIPPRRARGPHNLNGVLLQGEEATVYLGHLQQGGVFVAEGQELKAGQPIGLVGNSGMSLEPHLHIQAHANSRDGAPWYSQPQLEIQFFDRAYLLFEQIKAP